MPRTKSRADTVGARPRPGPEHGQDGRARLRAAGLRVTLPRLAVLDLVDTTTGHLSADEIRDRLRFSGIELQRSSVFNILAKLAAAGLIERLELGGAARFERAASAHDHFRCRSCGLVENVAPADVIRPVVSGRIESTTIVHVGLCRSCTNPRAQ